MVGNVGEIVRWFCVGAGFEAGFGVADIARFLLPRRCLLFVDLFSDLPTVS